MDDSPGNRKSPSKDKNAHKNASAPNTPSKGKTQKMSDISEAGLSMPMMRRAEWARTHNPNITQGPVAPVRGDRVWVVINANQFSPTAVTYPATIMEVRYREGSSTIIDTVQVGYFDGDVQNTHRNVAQVFFRHEIAPGDILRANERFSETYDDDAEERRYQRHLVMARDDEVGTGEGGEARAIMAATLAVGTSSRARIAEMARNNARVSGVRANSGGSGISRDKAKADSGSSSSRSDGNAISFRANGGAHSSTGDATGPRRAHAGNSSQSDATVSKKANIPPHETDNVANVDNTHAAISQPATTEDPDSLAAAATLAATISAETYAAAMAVLDILYPPGVPIPDTSNIIGVVGIPSDPRSLAGFQFALGRASR